MIRRTALVPRTAYERDARLVVVAVEGERTEPWYFDGLRERGWVPSRVRLVILPPDPERHDAGPEWSIQRLQRFREELDDPGLDDEHWLVTDVDRHHHLAATLAEVHQRGWSPAVSNPCFEVWLQLHVHETAVGTTHSEAKAAWRRIRALRAEHAFFERHEVEAACQRADRPSPGAIPEPPPATTVHRLVRRLLDLR